ncbi:glycosyltransferase [Corynebacterium sp. CQ3829_602738]
MLANFLGHTRFSLYDPTSPSWRLARFEGRRKESEYLKQLYSPERMGSRVEIFFDHSLPTLAKAAAAHNLVHVVSYSEELPHKYRAYLESADETYAWLRLDRRSEGNRKGRPLEKWAQQEFRAGDIFGEFRLDDDDILGVNFLDTLADYLTPENVGRYVSFGYGVQAFYDAGKFREPRVEHRPKIAIGLTRVCQMNANGTINGPKRVAHTKTDMVAPVILDSRAIQFLHSIHLNQDSGVNKPDGDLGNRFRNYLNQPKLEAVEMFTESFPTVDVGEDMSEFLKFNALAKSHSNLKSVSGTLSAVRKRLIAVFLQATLGK